jgi:hypothetical protein
MSVRRRNVLCDGIIILRIFGRTTTRFDVRFDDEPAVGIGPTHEFYNIFAEQFENSIFHPNRTNGCFPCPSTSSRDMEIFRRLLARLLLHQITVKWRINSLFFSLIRTFTKFSTQNGNELDEKAGERLQIGDLPFSSKLKSRLLHELPFVYEGVNVAPLVSHYSIIPIVDEDDETSLDNYCDLMMSLVGGKIYRKNMRHPFKRGFDAGFDNARNSPLEISFGFDYLCQLVTDDELVTLFYGVEDIFTEDDLLSIRFEDGYTDQ